MLAVGGQGWPGGGDTSDIDFRMSYQPAMIRSSMHASRQLSGLACRPLLRTMQPCRCMAVQPAERPRTMGQQSVHPLIRQIGAAIVAGAAGTVLALVRAAVCGADLQLQS